MSEETRRRLTDHWHQNAGYLSDLTAHMRDEMGPKPMACGDCPHDSHVGECPRGWCRCGKPAQPSPTTEAPETMPETPVEMYFTVDNYGCGASSVPMADHVKYVRADVVEKRVAEAVAKLEKRIADINSVNHKIHEDTSDILDRTMGQSLQDAARRVVAERDDLRRLATSAEAMIQDGSRVCAELRAERDEAQRAFNDQINSCQAHANDHQARTKDAEAERDAALAKVRELSASHTEVVGVATENLLRAETAERELGEARAKLTDFQLAHSRAVAALSGVQGASITQEVKP